MDNEEPKVRVKVRMTPELLIMGRCERLLNELPSDAQARVVRWLAETRNVRLPAVQCQFPGPDGKAAY